MGTTAAIILSISILLGVGEVVKRHKENKGKTKQTEWRR